MSVDMIMYRVDKLDEDDRALLKGTVVDEVACPDGDWEYKFYLQSDVEKNPEKYSEIIKHAKKIELQRIITNSKQCYIDHGLPSDTKTYSSRYAPWGIVVQWDGGAVSIPREALNRYSHEEVAVYYGVKRQYVDAGLSHWMAKTMMTELEGALGVDLSYHPHRLYKKSAEIMCKMLLRAHDEGDLYPSDEIMNFMCALMRCMMDNEQKIFVEFQD